MKDVLGLPISGLLSIIVIKCSIYAFRFQGIPYLFPSVNSPKTSSCLIFLVYDIFNVLLQHRTQKLLFLLSPFSVYLQSLFHLELAKLFVSAFSAPKLTVFVVKILLTLWKACSVCALSCAVSVWRLSSLWILHVNTLNKID